MAEFQSIPWDAMGHGNASHQRRLVGGFYFLPSNKSKGNDMNKYNTIARWETEDKKYYVELREWKHENGKTYYSFLAFNYDGMSGNGFGPITLMEAVIRCGKIAGYSPNKMTRVL